MIAMAIREAIHAEKKSWYEPASQLITYSQLILITPANSFPLLQPNWHQLEISAVLSAKKNIMGFFVGRRKFFGG